MSSGYSDRHADAAWENTMATHDAPPGYDRRQTMPIVDHGPGHRWRIELEVETSDPRAASVVADAMRRVAEAAVAVADSGDGDTIALMWLDDGPVELQ